MPNGNVVDDSAGKHSKICVVLGGRGFIGRALVERLLRLGNWNVRVADSYKSAELKPSESLLTDAIASGRAAYFQVDVRDKSQIVEAFRGVSVVFFTDSMDLFPQDFYLCYKVIVQGAKNVVNACRECNIKRLIYNSSADVVFDDVHDIRGGDESLPYAGQFWDMVADLRTQAEALILYASGTDDLLTCALRPCNVFGPGDQQLIPLLMNIANSNWDKFIIGSGNNLSDFTYVDNVAHAHICAEESLSARMDSVSGKAFFITNLEPKNFREFAFRFLERLGYPRPFINLPAQVAEHIFSLIKLLHRKSDSKKLDPSVSLYKLASCTRTFSCLAAQKHIKPDVVNCSARTGLDLLSKHYEDATGFDIVFFVPDSEEDFASYTEFLRYLGSKDRAGVAKFDDGTTLFLVPPSEFLTKVLKVSGPERLYGVVLKFAQVESSSAAINPRSIHPQYADPHKPTVPHTGYGPNQSEKRPLNNPRVLPENPNMPPRAPTPVTASFPAHSVPPTTAPTQAGLALTPELIATLTSLLPSNNASSGLQTASLLHTTSPLGATSNVATGADNMAHWKHEIQAVGQNSQLLQQLGGQMNPQLQHLQAAQTAHTVANATNHFHQMYTPNNQMNDHTMNMLTQGAASSKPMAPAFTSQSGQDANQYYLQGATQDVLRNQGMNNGRDAQRMYNPSIIQQQGYPMASSNQHSGVPQPQPYMPLPSSEVEAARQSQPPQAASPFGVTQESAETEAEKNERYKTTLLFAANLLSRIHQPSDNQPGQGAGSH